MFFHCPFEKEFERVHILIRKIDTTFAIWHSSKGLGFEDLVEHVAGRMMQIEKAVMDCELLVFRANPKTDENLAIFAGTSVRTGKWQPVAKELTP
jgi:hypothetical protein